MILKKFIHFFTNNKWWKWDSEPYHILSKFHQLIPLNFYYYSDSYTLEISIAIRSIIHLVFFGRKINVGAVSVSSLNHQTRKDLLPYVTIRGFHRMSRTILQASVFGRSAETQEAISSHTLCSRERERETTMSEYVGRKIQLPWPTAGPTDATLLLANALGCGVTTVVRWEWCDRKWRWNREHVQGIRTKSR